MKFLLKRFLSVCCILALVFTTIPNPALVYSATEGEPAVTTEEKEVIIEKKTFGFDPYDYSNLYDTVSFFAYSDLYQGSYGSELSGEEKVYYDAFVDYYIDASTGMPSGKTDSLEITLEDNIYFAIDENGQPTEEGNDILATFDKKICYAYFAFVYDFPELFWAGAMSSSYSYSYYTDAEEAWISSFLVKPEVSYDGADTVIKAYITGVSKAVETVTGKRESTDTYHTLKAIHDYLCETVTYDDAAVGDAENNMDAHSSGPVFTVENPEVVCEGYGEAFKVLCDTFDIPCALVVGEGNGGAHLWNYVEIDGTWYAVDVTWDDQESGIIYDYFLAGADVMSENHTPKNNSFDGDKVLSFAYPILSETAYEYNENTSIPKVDYDMSGVTFEDGTVTYDGTEKSLKIKGTLPEGVSVSYTNNGQIDAGTYTVTASFTGDTKNYNPIPDMTATLTIKKATYDMSAVTFNSGSFTYDGKAKSLKIKGTLPTGVSVSYTNNGKTKAGSYTVTVAFTGDSKNYNPIPSKTATLKINPASIAGKKATLSATTYTYNGSAKKPTVTITGLKNGTDYTVSYSNNIAVGTAKVTIKGKGNYTGTLTKTFTIKKPAITPTSVKAELYKDCDTIKVSWKKNSAATGYKVYYKKSTATKWSSKTTSNASITFDLSKGKTYQFKVVPMVKKVESSKAKTVSVTTLKQMKKPTVKKYSSKKVKVSWTKIKGATGYQVKQFTKIKTTSKGTSYKVIGKSKVMTAKKKTTYYYRVRAYYKTSAGKVIYGPWSTYKSHKLK